MSRRTVRAACLSLGVQLLSLLGVGAAQTNIETNAPGIQLNFSTPGARSLALGGSFLGRADDATAAYANPAGLANLPEREVSVELRSWDYTHVFTDRGRNGTPTGRGPDTVQGFVDGEASDQVAGASFASLVLPRRRWAVAVFTHTLANFEANFATRGAFVGEAVGPFDDTLRLFPVESSSRMKILNNGIAASYRLSQSLSIGVGLSRYDFEIDSTLERYRFEEGIYGELGVDATVRANTQTQQGSDSDLGMTLGVLWRLSPRWQLGALYRQGPGFDFEARNRNEARPDAQVDKQARFNVPDVWGLGAMFQATDRLIAGLDVYRIGYSSLAADFTDVLVPGPGSAADFASEDGTEVHAGLEYAFPNGTRPWFLRTGVWLDPDHGVRFVGSTETDNGALDAARFRPRKDIVHFAFGAGIVGSSYQFDGGVDYSQRTLTLSVSTVVRF